MAGTLITWVLVFHLDTWLETSIPNLPTEKECVALANYMNLSEWNGNIRNYLCIKSTEVPPTDPCDPF